MRFAIRRKGKLVTSSMGARSKGGSTLIESIEKAGTEYYGILTFEGSDPGEPLRRFRY